MKISCLCLDKRKDMWLKLKEQVERIIGLEMETFVVGDGSDPELVYDHIDVRGWDEMLYYGQNPRSHFNAFLCHRKMAQRAIDEGVDQLLILEDDSYIIEDRQEILFSDKINIFLLNEDWDIVYLGWWLTKADGNSVDREDLEKLWKEERKYDIEPVPHIPEVKYEICGLHGLLVNKHFLSAIANAPAGPIDSLLNHNFDKIKAYYVWPKVIHVHSTWSYCENSFTEREKL